MVEINKESIYPVPLHSLLNPAVDFRDLKKLKNFEVLVEKSS